MFAVIRPALRVGVLAGRIAILVAFISVQCAYNQRVEAPDSVAPPSPPFVPPSPPPPDTTPPGNARSILITPSHQQLQISYEPPPDGDYKGTRIYWATTPTNLNSAAARTLLCENCSAPVTHTGLINGNSYSYLFVTYDQQMNAASGVTVTAIPTNTAATCDNTADDDCLQIASFNLQYFVSGFDGSNSASLQSAKQTGAANVILSAGFDIVALQEIKDYGIFTAWVSSALGNDWGHIISASGCSARTAFIYRRSLVSLLSTEELAAPPFNSANWDGCLRKPLVAIFKAKHSDRQFRLINLHLKSGSDSASCATRQPQAEDVTNYYNNTNTTATLILGDLNDEVKNGLGICSAHDTLNSFETNVGLNILTQSPQLDSNRFTNIPYSSTIDHMMVNATFQGWLVPARATFLADIVTHGDLNISDHQPVFLWIKLR